MPDKKHVSTKTSTNISAKDKKYLIVYKMDGSTLVKQYKEVQDACLKVLQKEVQGRIEILNEIRYKNVLLAVIINESALHEYPAWYVPENTLVHNLVPDHYSINDKKVLVGNVVIVKSNGEDFFPLSLDEIKYIERR